MLISKELTPTQVETLIQCHVEHPNWPRSIINKLFARRVKKDENGVVCGTLEPYMHTYDTFFLPAKTLPNQPEGVNTTAGSFFFNSYILVGSFGDSIKYINKAMRMDDLDELAALAMSKVQSGEFKPEQFERYMNKIFRLTYITEPFLVPISTKFLKPDPKVMKMKKELEEKYKDEIAAGNAAVYAEKIEKPLLDFAREQLKNEDSYVIYEAKGKPDFENNHKNNNICVGGLPDPITKKYEIISNSYSEGLDPSQYPTHANKMINASYNRSVETQFGGAKTKFLFAAMQNVVAGPKGSDCKTTKTLNTVINKKHKRDYMFRYVVDKGKLVCLTPDNIDSYVDKPIKLRSPLYCTSKNVCNMCLGDLFYKLNITNVGLTATRTTASVMQIAMKAMHDVTIKTVEVNPFQYMELIDKPQK